MKTMGLVRGTDERLRILSFWWMLELFNPQQVPPLTRTATGSRDGQVIAWRPGEPPPWEVLAAPEPRNGRRMVWRHTVFLGVYKLDATYAALERVFGEDPDAYDKRPDAQSACAGLLIDSDGRLVTDSAVLSSALWAAGRVRDPGVGDAHWIYGFEKALESFRWAVDDLEGARCDADGGDEPPPQDSGSLIELSKLAHVAAGVDGFEDLASDRVVIKSTAVSERQAADDADFDFLNSFYLDDLATVREHVARGDFGAGLAAYLTGDAELPVSGRIDVIEHPDVVDRGVAIVRASNRMRWRRRGFVPSGQVPVRNGAATEPARVWA